MVTKRDLLLDGSALCHVGKALCSDRGRRINNAEPDWPQTLEGRPKLAYEFWNEHLKPLGLGLRAQVVDYPGGMPGDIGFILTWN